MIEARRVPVIDCDSHLTEPPDLWAARLPSKWSKEGPRVEWNPTRQEEFWRIGDRWCMPVGANSIAGWPEPYPSRPTTFGDINPECHDPQKRVDWMDRYGIERQVLYPNLVAFEGHALMSLEDQELARACIRAYNDYQQVFSAQSPGRFIPIAALPFWDQGESIKELERCALMGFPGVLWAATLDRHGLPGLTDPHWDPFYAAAQDHNMSINLHIGVGLTEEERDVNKMAKGNLFDAQGNPIAVALAGEMSDPLYNVRRTAVAFMSNARTIADIVTSGICERFPRLRFVSVESGFGFVPFLLESLDWQWHNLAGKKLAPERNLPSDNFRSHVYTMFWFEQSSMRELLDYADNVMFETDFPHPTSLSPGPGSAAPGPDQIIASHLKNLDEETRRKVLYDNAAHLYNIE